LRLSRVPKGPTVWREVPCSQVDRRLRPRLRFEARLDLGTKLGVVARSLSTLVGREGNASAGMSGVPKGTEFGLPTIEGGEWDPIGLVSVKPLIVLLETSEGT